jgi:hypothetical protein
MNISDIITFINSGEVDDDLDTIIDTARSRQRRAATARAQEFRRGDIIRVVGNISPKYLLGAEATVVEVAGGKITARMNSEVGRYREGAEVGIPAVCVQRVSS